MQPAPPATRRNAARKSSLATVETSGNLGTCGKETGLEFRIQGLKSCDVMVKAHIQPEEGGGGGWGGVDLPRVLGTEHREAEKCHSIDRVASAVVAE
jgi:hypothetical protein